MNRKYHYEFMFKYLFIDFICCITFCLVIPAAAQNPIVLPGLYLADPSPHVWNDTLFVYGSKDESPSYYCSQSYDVYWTTDLIHWYRKENIFSIRNIPELKNIMLYAPDCVYRNGKYYLYFGLSNGRVGVAVSDSPAGPFQFSNLLNLYGYDQIDPSVFVDDDGSYYLIWGQFNAKIAKLEKNMIEIDSSTIHEGFVNERDHFFHEGAHLIKYNGLYYFIYADIQRANTPSCLGYSVSKSVFGPYTYKGVIIDNDHCDPGNWNNHGNIVQFKGDWYIFYHRSTDSSFSLRKTCIERIHFNLDGSIPEVQMTSNGVLPFLNPFLNIFPESICMIFGNARIHYDGRRNALQNIEDNNRVLIRYLNFKHPADSVSILFSAENTIGSIEIIPDQPWLAPIGKIYIHSSIKAQNNAIIKSKIQSLVGIHSIWIKFHLNHYNDLKIYSIKFE